MNISRYTLAAAISSSLALGGCQQRMGPEAQRLYDEELAKIEGRLITLDAYEQIGSGSSYEEAVYLLGEGTEVTRSRVGGQDIVIYQWVRPDGGNIALTYNHGALVSKSQAGLT